MSDKREMFAIWLRLKDGTRELFHGVVTEYRAQGWERCTTNLIIDSMTIALSRAGYEVIGSA